MAKYMSQKCSLSNNPSILKWQGRPTTNFRVLSLKLQTKKLAFSKLVNSSMHCSQKAIKRNVLKRAEGQNYIWVLAKNLKLFFVFYSYTLP